jgi:hypothetical protein
MGLMRGRPVVIFGSGPSELAAVRPTHLVPTYPLLPASPEIMWRSFKSAVLQ